MTESMEHGYARRKGLYPGGTVDEYDDIRHGLDSHHQIPCSECDGSLWVSWGFPEDEWYCRDCKPDRLREMHTGSHVTVRL